MAQKNHAMGIKVSSEIVQQVKLRMADLECPHDTYKTGWTQENLAEMAGLGVKTVKRFLAGEPVNSNSLFKIIKSVGLKPEDVIDAPLNETEASIVNWIAICGGRLAKQKEARQLRKEATAIGAEVNVYVPLNLLEHQEKTRSKKDRADSDQRNQYQEPKVVKTYEHKDFLDSLTDRQSKNKHIAIVGEAGAGKTTLLARIAEELDKKQKLQIFVSLADLRERSLEEHIYGNWLSKALAVHKDSIDTEQKNDLFQQFQSGEIWLLLDGLDEMRAKSSADALEKINREIKEVIGQSRVVLTSRLNVWDAYLNRLSGFDTFRMGDFSPEQVDKFIGDWFVEAGKPESAPILRAKLKEPNRDRIRDMVRHPLRLALLCQAFYRDLNTELPETKAGLYELFVHYFYEWKPNIVDEDLTQDTLREELHLALGKLAIAGIDGDAGFRLSRSLAVKEMGDRLFKLASDVGWLTLIERDEQDQEVYAFYHASFQEYFAALAIDEWDFFMPSNHIDKPLQNEKYRIFEPQWKDCFLFWIGQENRILKTSKEDLIKFLWNFKDDCGSFYSRRAKCIAVSATGEFGNCDNQLSQEIIGKTLKAAFSGYNYLIEPPVVLQARSCLLETNPVQVLQIVQNLLNTEEISNTKEVREEICNHFGKYWSKNKEIVNLLLENKLEGKLFQDNCYGGNISHLLNDKLLKNLGSRFADFVVNSFVNSFFTVVGKEQKPSQYIDYTISEDEIESAYQSHLEEIQLRQEDKIIIKNAKDAESLIAIFYSEPPIVYDDTLIIDRIIEDYPNSNCSNKFIVDILTSSCKDASLHESGRLYLDWNSRHIISCFNKFPAKLFSILVFQIRQYIRNPENIDQLNEYCGYYEILWHCADRMKYADFHAALHQSMPIHPEVADFIPASNTDSLRDLETQFVNLEAIQEELDRNANHPEIRCLVIDVRHLEQESDPNVIAKKLTNKIFNSIGRRIPVVQDVSCLERELLNLKFDLGFEKLAIALYGKSANEAIDQLCQSLTESIPLRQFTGEKTSEQLTNEVKAWLRRINLEYN